MHSRQAVNGNSTVVNVLYITFRTSSSKTLWPKIEAKTHLTLQDKQRSKHTVIFSISYNCKYGIDFYFTVWNLHASGHSNSYGYRRSAPSTLLNHLASCVHQTNVIRDAASRDSARTSVSSPRGRRRQAAINNFAASGSVPPIHSALFQNDSAAQDLSVLPFNNPSLTPYHSVYGTQINAYQHAQSPALPSPLILSPAVPFPPALSISSPGLRPEDSASASGSRGSQIVARASPQVLVQNFPFGIWNQDRQSDFEKRLAKITASAGLPLAWVDNPEWIGFCDTFIPQAHLPTRKTITNRIIPNLVKELHDKALTAVSGNYATIQADGWTGVNSRHLLAFMMTADKKVFLILSLRLDLLMQSEC